MDYELEKGYFFSDVKEMLEELTGEPVVLETVTKCNGVIMHGFRKTGKRESAEMRKNDSEDAEDPVDDIVPEESVKHGRETFAVAYIDNIFPVFKDGHTTIREVAENIIRTWENEEKKEFDFDFVWNADYIKENVFYKLVNFAYNRDFLEDVPYVKFLDLAMVFYVSIDIGNGFAGSMIIKNEHLGKLNLTENVVYECAMSNTQNKLSGRVMDMVDSLSAVAKKMNMPEDIIVQYEKQARGNMYVGTNNRMMFGAAVLAYPNFIEDFSRKIENRDLVIIPSSVHEIIIVPVTEDFQMDRIKEIVMEVNRTQLDWTEVLSDSVYYYDNEKQELAIV